MAKETKSVRENDALVLDCATEVMCGYLSKNPLAVSYLPSVIKSVHAVIRGLHEGHAGLPGALNKLPVPIKKSIGEDFLICFEDGLKFKSRWESISNLGLEFVDGDYFGQPEITNFASAGNAKRERSCHIQQRTWRKSFAVSQGNA